MSAASAQRTASATKKCPPLKVVVILGTVRPHRLGDRVGKCVSEALKQRGHQVTLFDPLEKKLPLLEMPLHHYPDPSKAPQVLRDMDAAVRAADAFVVITAEYNRCIPPALSNILDHLSPKSYAYRPGAIVSYSPGPGAGIMASSQLRMLLGELGMLTLPMIMSLGMVDKKIDENGKAVDASATAGEGLLLDQLELVGGAMKQQLSSIGGLDKAPKSQPYL